MLSFAFSLRLSFVTSRTTVAPDGIVTPFVPVTASVVVAVSRSPTLFVFVQTFCPNATGRTLLTRRHRVAPRGPRQCGRRRSRRARTRRRGTARRRARARRRRRRRRGRWGLGGNVLELRLRRAVAARELQVAVQCGISRERAIRTLSTLAARRDCER